jgi:predicted neuraminidase
MRHCALIATVVVSAVLGYRPGDAAPQPAPGTVLRSGGFQLLETTIDEFRADEQATHHRGPPASTRALRRDTAAQGAAQSDFVFETAPFPSAHASTIVETQEQLVVAWFGGTREGASDVGIWLSRREKNGWTSPIEVANGKQADGTRYPCWNPVLFALSDNVLMLFYKVGPSPQAWWGMVQTSQDAGRTWPTARRLPDGVLGPIKNKPVRLSDGTLMSPSSTESPQRPSTWRIHFERSADAGLTWTAVHPAQGDGGDKTIEAIQPSVLLHGGERLQAVGRTRSGRIFETWSSDRGRTWTPVALTALPNPNSGIDAVTLRDGRHLIVYNHTTQGRSPLNVALSRDGTTWQAALVLEHEPGEYSYPAVIQTRDGLVHITYTWKRERIRHVAIDPAKLKPMAMADGSWPKEIR